MYRIFPQFGLAFVVFGFVALHFYFDIMRYQTKLASVKFRTHDKSLRILLVLSYPSLLTKTKS